MSSYLFVLVMEVLSLLIHHLIEQDMGFSYHWHCQELGLFQFCFADELLLFCKANVSSVNVFKRGLDMFASMSRLHVNPSKSHLIISKSTHDVRDGLLTVLDFQEGHLPVRYLGLPLLPLAS
ncbi:UNVERIFIED_CONTAM: hypothetical protein Slati_2695100 [Sesamum latifolium]|uniref:Reverse transcriptase domain-containing protein n=1 Tax=Sesamum latifolium TaxID=2727402 RepID=A0AAW2VWT0_9LAMI